MIGDHGGSLRGPRSYQLTVPACQASLDAIHDLVATALTQQPRLSTADRIRFEVAVIEVANNIIEHSAPGPHDGRNITCELTVTAYPERITARFRDDGEAAKVDLAAPQMPDEMAEGGRGIALTRALVEGMSYERDGSTNIWTLTMLTRAVGTR